MSRRIYEIFCTAWPFISTANADRLNGSRKYVFASTLDRAEWNNTTVLNGGPVAEVTKLKQEDGRDPKAAPGHTRSPAHEAAA
jgi:dihydrofolate reductase